MDIVRGSWLEPCQPGSQPLADAQAAGTGAEDTAEPGVVVIGRNEGERLARCLRSVIGRGRHVVYVDSGSTDGSVAMGRALGVDVVELDPRVPFTAARARNAGLRRLLERDPQLRYAFFVDGDCEVAEGWLETAARFLTRHPYVAVVWGRRREKYPQQSIYNRLCDLEWAEVPSGETRACGGDAVVRVAAFRQVDGYRAELICGEEPELCLRLRRAGWRIWRLDAAMTVHDAALYRFGQWWRRMMRSGYAYALGASLHGAAPERHWVTESRRAWIWGLCLPLAIAALTLAGGGWALWLLWVYPLQIARLALRRRRPADSRWLHATALVVGKFAEMAGQVKFVLDRRRRTRPGLIEYK